MGPVDNTRLFNIGIRNEKTMQEFLDEAIRRELNRRERLAKLQGNNCKPETGVPEGRLASSGAR